MLNKINKDIKKNITQLEDIPFEIKQEIRAIKERTINFFTIDVQKLTLKRVDAFWGEKKTKMHIVVEFDFTIPKEIKKFSQEIILIATNTPDKNISHPKLETIFNTVEKAFNKIFESISFHSFSLKDKDNNEIVVNSPEYYMAHQMISEFVDHNLWPFYCFELIGFLNIYTSWIEKSKKKLFLISNQENSKDLMRNCAPMFEEKTNANFFGTDPNTLDYAIKAHKDIYSSLHNDAKQTRGYKQYSNNLNTLKFWIQRYRQPSGYNSWRDLIYMNDSIHY